MLFEHSVFDMHTHRWGYEDIGPGLDRLPQLPDPLKHIQLRVL